MFIEATSIGLKAVELLRKEGPIGKIHSVYHSALNINVNEGLLVSIVGRETGNGPVNVLTNLPYDIFNLNINRESSVVQKDKILNVGLLCVSLEKAEVWEPEKDIITHSSVEVILDNWNAAKKVAGLYARTDGFGKLIQCIDVDGSFLLGDNIPLNGLGIFASRAFGYIVKLIEASRVGNMKDIINCSSHLIGLGPGLTPSGDDFLTGFMISLYLVTKALGGNFESVKDINKVITWRLDERTGILSKNMLWYAAIGEGNEAIHLLISALLSGSNEHVRCAVLRLLNVGHSSGSDIALGVLLGFRAVKELDGCWA